MVLAGHISRLWHVSLRPDAGVSDDKLVCHHPISQPHNEWWLEDPSTLTPRTTERSYKILGRYLSTNFSNEYLGRTCVAGRRRCSPVNSSCCFCLGLFRLEENDFSVIWCLWDESCESELRIVDKEFLL